jgi:hypothetical protein
LHVITGENKQQVAKGGKQTTVSTMQLIAEFSWMNFQNDLMSSMKMSGMSAASLQQKVL